MKCNKCGSENLILTTSGPHDKLVCGDCLTFQKFLSKADALTFRQMQGEQEFDRDFGEHMCPDPTRLSDVDELKAGTLRKVEEAEEYLKNKEVDEMSDTKRCSKCKRPVSIFEMSERGHLWLCSICTIAHDRQEEAEDLCK